LTRRDRSAIGSWALPVFGRLWKAYPRQTLQELSVLLTA
jgi:hypothetical protein